MNDKGLEIIGSTEYVEVAGIKDIPAKIDTGADSSSIWASNIDMEKDGTLSFMLFAEGSPFFTGEPLKTKDYFIKVVRSAHGDEQVRYRVKLPLKLGQQSFETTFTLASRAKNNFPILIGRHTLEDRFLVNVAIRTIETTKNHRTTPLNDELKKDPYAFHQKYVKM
ncbi:ATP-dependent zinc protease [Candidatus Saccharibacteria bacterium]|nr:ATP-dependent zinc protease [Candidatus Saccharibacteria bacterium]